MRKMNSIQKGDVSHKLEKKNHNKRSYLATLCTKLTCQIDKWEDNNNRFEMCQVFLGEVKHHPYHTINVVAF